MLSSTACFNNDCVQYNWFISKRTIDHIRGKVLSFEEEKEPDLGQQSSFTQVFACIQ
ncbi:unnamed protein product [Moneuplotes crassus]|uniref:Uncharacterized protein n=1 Tax=Euplotes crassus TaxID=5936 RepID=A0AAD1U3L6_EUPCR|nr:unnamed protein product [Moneuplotes crassus]